MALSATYYQPALHPELEVSVPARTDEELEYAQARNALKGYLQNLLDYIRTEKIALATARSEREAKKVNSPKEPLNKETIRAMLVAQEAVSASIGAHAAEVTELRAVILRSSQLAGGFVVAHDIEIDDGVQQALSTVAYCQYDVANDALMATTIESRRLIHFQPEQIVV